MYMKSDTIVISVLFIAIIFISIWFSTTPTYHSMCSSSRLSHAPYEGFTSQQLPLEYSQLGDSSAKDDLFLNNSISTVQSECKKVAGFSGAGVFCNPSLPEIPVDIYSEAKGDGKCFGSSSGYSNSKGPLCMNDKMNYLLSSRGANATGGDSQIGSKV